MRAARVGLGLALSRGLTEAMGTYNLDGCGYMQQGCASSFELQGVPLSVRSTPLGLYVNDWTARELQAALRAVAARLRPGGEVLYHARLRVHLDLEPAAAA